LDEKFGAKMRIMPHKYDPVESFVNRMYMKYGIIRNTFIQGYSNDSIINIIYVINKRPYNNIGNVLERLHEKYSSKCNIQVVDWSKLNFKQQLNQLNATGIIIAGVGTARGNSPFLPHGSIEIQTNTHSLQHEKNINFFDFHYGTISNFLKVINIEEYTREEAELQRCSHLLYKYVDEAIMNFPNIDDVVLKDNIPKPVQELMVKKTDSQYAEWRQSFSNDVGELFSIVPTTYVVTAASQNHIKSLKQFISTVDVSKCQLIVWDIGIESYSLLELLSLFDFEYHKFDFSKYPEYYNVSINAGQYAWKPSIIKETTDILLQKHNGGPICLFWCDAGNKLRGDSLQILQNTLMKNKLFSPTSIGTVAQWTHPNTLQYFYGNRDIPMINKPPRNGAQYGFLISDKDIQQFVNEFDMCAKRKECIAPVGSNRTNHRQDQAVFTILFYKFFELHSKYVLRDEYICDIHCDID
jgi:hypothetical protein